MPRGFVMLTEGKGLFSKLIIWQTGARDEGERWSHALFVLETDLLIWAIDRIGKSHLYSVADPTAPWSVIESYEPKGVRADRSVAQVVEGAKRAQLYRVHGMSDLQWEQLAVYAAASLGYGYDWRSVLRFIPRSRATVNNKYYCSEFVAEKIEQAYRPLLKNVAAQHISPRMISHSQLLLEDSLSLIQ